MCYEPNYYVYHTKRAITWNWFRKILRIPPAMAMPASACAACGMPALLPARITSSPRALVALSLCRLFSVQFSVQPVTLKVYDSGLWATSSASGISFIFFILYLSAIPDYKSQCVAHHIGKGATTILNHWGYTRERVLMAPIKEKSKMEQRKQPLTTSVGPYNYEEVSILFYVVLGSALLNIFLGLWVIEVNCRRSIHNIHIYAQVSASFMLRRVWLS